MLCSAAVENLRQLPALSIDDENATALLRPRARRNLNDAIDLSREGPASRVF
jgi:hypothetical protein